MEAYLIDPFDKNITKVEYTGDFRNIYQHIGAPLFDCVIINDQGDIVYVDDEGLFKPNQAFFSFRGHRRLPLAGKGLVLGTDEEGESTPPKISLEEVKELIFFQ